MMGKSIEIIFLVLRAALGLLNKEELYFLSLDINWNSIYRIAQQQGVLAIAWDGISAISERLDIKVPRSIKLKWVVNAELISEHYRRQWNVATDIAYQFNRDKSIQTIVLKGFSLAILYPEPAHRQCGDFDCFLMGDYDVGNNLAESYGAFVERDYYVHSHILYKGLTIENHQFCTPIKGGNQTKNFERILQYYLYHESSNPINNSCLHSPSIKFTALYLVHHTFRHFLSEGIKLRHILDWALLLKAEQNNIDWEEFYKWTDRMNMTRFADALTAISVEHLGLEITNPAIHTTSPYAERILHDTLYSSEGVFNKKASAWTKRLMLVRNKFSYGWKYHKIYQKSILVELTRSVFAFLFEKNPKL